MGLVSLVICAVEKCWDFVFMLLDINFEMVHSVVLTVPSALTYINSLPPLLLSSLLKCGNSAVCCLVSAAEASSNLAQGLITKLGMSLGQALGGLLESLKMVGYLLMHVLHRGRDHLCKNLLSIVEGCGTAVNLVVYFINTVANYALITTQNLYQGVVFMCQRGPELALTSIAFLYSSLVGMLAFLWSPCKLVLDFLVSLVHMFISIFILNIYGLMLTAVIAVATTVYLNPGQARQAAVYFVDYINTSPTFRRVKLALKYLVSSLRTTPQYLHGAMQCLQRILHHLYLLERGLWPQLSRLSSQLGLVLRTHLHRDNNRARGDGDPGAEERRDPPDGRANDALPSTSTDRPLKKQSKDTQTFLPEDLLDRLKEQEERKMCVICQDCMKTVVLLPCRHLCLCKGCKNILLRQPIHLQNCPLCRHMILNTLDVFV